MLDTFLRLTASHKKKITHGEVSLRWNISTAKRPYGEMSLLRNVQRRIVQWRNVLRRKVLEPPETAKRQQLSAIKPVVVPSLPHSAKNLCY